MPSVLHLAKLVGGYNSTQKYFHYTGIVGTVRAVTDIYGAVAARYAYEPFGSLTTASGLVDSELHRFMGKHSDLETSLSYFNARYYDPTLGRFTSSDPAKDGLNWFVYCDGNPLILKDNDGRKKLWVVPVGLSPTAHKAIERALTNRIGEKIVRTEKSYAFGRYDLAIEFGSKWHLYEIKPISYSFGYKNVSMLEQLERYLLGLAVEEPLDAFVLGTCLTTDENMITKLGNIEFDEYKPGAFISIFAYTDRPGELYYLIDGGEKTNSQVPKWLNKLLPWLIAGLAGMLGMNPGSSPALAPAF